MGKKEANNSWLTDELVVYAMQTAYHYARKYNGVPLEDKKDFQQDALAKLVRVANKYNPSKGAPKTFIAIVVKNAIRDSLRKHNRRSARLDYFNNDIDNVISPEEGEDINDLIDNYINDKLANQFAKMLHNGDTIAEVAKANNWRVQDTRNYSKVLCATLKKAIMTNEPIKQGDLTPPAPKGN